jgi:PhnB protein
MNQAVKPVPEGYQSVIPYLVATDAVALIEFMKQTFNAQELLRMASPDGSIGHAELRIGDSVVMLGQAGEQWKAMPCMLYLYVPDTDAVYHRAIAAGGVSVKEPQDQFYGDRTAGVQDICGNQWFIGTHIEDVSPEELDRRFQAARGAK